MYGFGIGVKKGMTWGSEGSKKLGNLVTLYMDGPFEPKPYQSQLESCVENNEGQGEL